MSSKYVFLGVTAFVIMSLFGMAAMIQRDRSLDPNSAPTPMQKLLQKGSK